MLKVTAVDVVNLPNYYSPSKNNRWEIIDPNAVDLSGQLTVDDQLSVRAYVPALGSSLIVVFQRADLIQKGTTFPITLNNSSQSVTKTATINTDNRSLFKISMTTQDVQNVVSGTVKFTLTEGGIAKTWVQNWFLQKSLTGPGS